MAVIHKAWLDYAQFALSDMTEHEKQVFELTFFAGALAVLDELKRLGRIPPEPRPQSKVEFGTMRSPFDNEKQIYFIECGADGGKFSAIIPGWVGAHKVYSKVIAKQ